MCKGSNKLTERLNKQVITRSKYSHFTDDYRRGIVSMDQQRPRDNAMYFVGERTNLKSMDKALKHATGKHTAFSHKVLTSGEIEKHCKTSKAQSEKDGLGNSKKQKRLNA